MLVFSVVSWVIFSRLWVTIRIPSKFILLKNIQFEHCFIFLNIYQNNDKMESGSPPTSDQIPPTSGSSDWTNWDPHIAYSCACPLVHGECAISFTFKIWEFTT